MESRYPEAAGEVALRRDSSEGPLPSSRFRVEAPRPMRRGPAISFRQAINTPRENWRPKLEPSSPRFPGIIVVADVLLLPL